MDNVRKDEKVWLRALAFERTAISREARERDRRRRKLSLEYEDCGPWKAEILSNPLAGGGGAGLLLVLLTTVIALAGGIVSLAGIRGLMRLLRLNWAIVPRSAFLVISIPLALLFFHRAAPAFYRIEQRVNGTRRRSI